MTIRTYFPGMGEAVADRTINRKIFTKEQAAQLPVPLVLNQNDPHLTPWQCAAELSCHPLEFSDTAPHQSQLPDTKIETWGDVAKRVAEGNTKLVEGESYDELTMYDHVSRGTLLMSGRHLQHTDRNLKFRPQEVITNCATSVMSFVSFYLLLNGAGVGRAYDDDMMLVDWRKMPNIKIAIAKDYPDRLKTKFEWSEATQSMVEIPMVGAHFKSLETTLRGTLKGSKTTVYYVEDSRGGWAKAVEQVERMAFEGRSDEYLILDFSKVRSNGKPIRGMQNRPASGPGPLMDALYSIAQVKYMRDLDPWESTMHVDHYLAQCVLVGGARRAARMATKFWKDPTIFAFIDFKRRNNFWTSNNSVTTDAEFRELSSGVVNKLRGMYGDDYDSMTPDELIGATVDLMDNGKIKGLELHAFRVLVEIADAAYYHGTGEPAIINQDKLKADDRGVEDYVDGLFAGSKDFQLDRETLNLTEALGKRVNAVKYTMIVNPCGEIALLMLGSYCVIADVVPFHAENDDDAEQAFRAATRALIRANSMDSLYQREVARTNRIGVGMTGLHEWIYDRFGFDWHDVVNEERSKVMWQTLSRFRRAITDEAKTYSTKLGVVQPHTDTTMKPAGCASLSTTVKTSDGVLSMGELFENQGFDPATFADATWLEPTSKIQVFDMDNNAKDVTKLYVNGVKPVFEITFEDGTIAKLTGNHKLMTADGWKRVDELSDGDDIIQH